MSLTHLQQLEAESIHIIREVAAEFANPVMLYSIGKDSSVLLHLARKAFAPGKIPFPLLQVDTNWKFAEMITFRDQLAKDLGNISPVDLIYNQCILFSFARDICTSSFGLSGKEVLFHQMGLEFVNGLLGERFFVKFIYRNILIFD